MQKDLKKTTGAGVQVVAVSYDPVNVLKDFSDQHKITYPLLSDTSSKTIDAYGIRNTRVRPRQDGIPHPGTFLIDGQGIIRSKGNTAMHRYVKRIVSTYGTRVYQRTMDELYGHHEERVSPAWNWTTKGVPVVLEVGGGSRVDSRAIRRIAERHATQLLGRILLREE